MIWQIALGMENHFCNVTKQQFKLYDINMFEKQKYLTLKVIRKAYL